MIAYFSILSALLMVVIILITDIIKNKEYSALIGMLPLCISVLYIIYCGIKYGFTIFVK